MIEQEDPRISLDFHQFLTKQNHHFFYRYNFHRISKLIRMCLQYFYLFSHKINRQLRVLFRRFR